jgi:error-prone DNA polymerase
MSRKRSREALLAYRESFVRGALGRGVNREVAERVFGQIEGFSGFGFPKSHAAAFALLAYQSTWLRVHYGPELLAALLNEQPMGFYPPDALVHEAQRRGIEVHGPDVNASRVECHTQEDLAVRVGLGYVKGLAEEEARAVVAERGRDGAYRGMADLAARAGISLEALELLAWSGACEALPGGARRADLWRAAGARSRRERSGTQLSLPIPVAEAPGLPEPDAWESAAADYTTTGMTLGTHPMALIRPSLEAGRRDPHSAPVRWPSANSPESPHENPAYPPLLSIRDLAEVGHGETISIAGMVVARQRPETAKGIVFVLIEDEFGQLNLIVPPPLYDRNRMIVRTAPFLLARGRFERREGVTNLVVTAIEEIVHPSAAPAELRAIAEQNSEWRSDPREADRLAELAAAAPPAHSWGRR